MKLIFNTGYWLEDTIFHLGQENPLRFPGQVWETINGEYENDEVYLELIKRLEKEVFDKKGNYKVFFKKLEYKQL